MIDTSTINSLGGYPLGAENDPRAPYNEKQKEKVKVNVTVSVTYSKTFDVEVEEGYESTDLIDAVKESGILPNDIIIDQRRRLRKYIKRFEKDLPDKLKAKLIKKRDLYKPWIEDELEVIPNDTETNLLF